jgi:cell division protease FtsH
MTVALAMGCARPMLDENSPMPTDAKADIDFDELVQSMVKQIEERQFAEALASLDTILRIAPTLPMAHRFRGFLQCQMGDFNSSLESLNESLRLEPDNELTYIWRGDTFLRLGDYGQALSDYTDAIRLDPNDHEAYVARGSAYLWEEGYSSAVDDFTKANRLKPGTAGVFALRAQAYFELNEFDRALADVHEAIRLDPENADALTWRARIHEIDAEFDAAVADLTTAIQLAPENAGAYLDRGAVWSEMEEFHRAVADFSEKIRIAPDAESYRWRGDAWDALEEYERADQDFAKADEIEFEEGTMAERKTLIRSLLQTHFEPHALDELSVTERCFPFRVRADLQLAIDRLFEKIPVHHFCGVRKLSAQGVNFTDLLVRDRDDPALAVAPQYEEIDIGEDKPVRCLQSGLWLFEEKGSRFAVFLEPATHYARAMGIRFQIAAANKKAGARITQAFFKHLEEAVQQARCYRGKVLSLEWEQNYSGSGTGIKVHKLRPVKRSQVILPQQTLELLDRNVLNFVRRRAELSKLGLSTKKGLLLYGLPGSGKTHTIHYLASALEGMTTLLISAEQVGGLADYMALARLLQPSMVVLEDVDLIARDRESMGSPCEEVLLNRLLNEMDGLKEDAEILFMLTTNRPEALEAALASRPGRVDQAIEFPFPDREGRRKLVRLYSRGVRVAKDVVEAAVNKTENASPAFIKELMRRATQFKLERDGSDGIIFTDLENALQELLFKGGSLNRKLLGGRIEESPDAQIH